MGRSPLGLSLQFIAALGALALPIGICALVYMRRRRQQPRGFDVMMPQEHAETGAANDPQEEK